MIENGDAAEQPSGVGRGIGFVLFGCRTESDLALEKMQGVVVQGGVPLDMKYTEDQQKPVAPSSAGQVIPTLSRGGGPMRSGYSARGARYNPMGGARGPAAQSGASFAKPTADSAEKNEAGFIIFAYNIGYETDETQLYNLFAQYGAVAKVNVIQDFKKQQGKGYGFVTMADQAEAETAVESLNGYSFNGNKLQVRFKSPKSDSPAVPSAPRGRGMRGGPRGSMRGRGGYGGYGGPRVPRPPHGGHGGYRGGPPRGRGGPRGRGRGAPPAPSAYGGYGGYDPNTYNYGYPPPPPRYAYEAEQAYADYPDYHSYAY